MEHPNVMTAAWTGILCSDPPKTYVSIRPSRYSYGILREKGEFVIHLPTAAQAKKVDYCGIYTGSKVNKFEKCAFTPIESTAVAAPTIAECPIALECRVCEVVPLGSHDMFLADIVAVTVEDDLLDEAGKLHMERAGLCAYAHGEYYALGRRLGKFGFSATKRKPARGGRKGGSKG
jgi:flavin reductase (DIM6/NTAB) family NADH-FMN oxidoreductase RutF